jgi:hypothetical protein
LAESRRKGKTGKQKQKKKNREVKPPSLVVKASSFQKQEPSFLRASFTSSGAPYKESIW